MPSCKHAAAVCQRFLLNTNHCKPACVIKRYFLQISSDSPEPIVLLVFVVAYIQGSHDIWL